MSKKKYTLLGGLTALLALVINQFLWIVTNLGFGPGVIIGVLAPILIGGSGVAIGLRAIPQYGRRFGATIVGTNILAIIVGLVWSLVVQPRAFGPSPVPV